MDSIDTIIATGPSIRYLDNAATTFPKPECVYTYADQFYRRFGGNAGRGNNPFAQIDGRLVSETRQLLATTLGISKAEGLIFTASATHALNLVILGMRLQVDDTVYVTPFEHNSVLRPAAHLAKSCGAGLVEIPFDKRTFGCQLSKLAGSFAVRPPTLVCVTQASNVCGVMPPVVDIARLAKKANPQAIVVVDGAQVAGLYPLPLDDGLIDGYVFSGHKSLYGPYGIAGAALASGWRPEPLVFGGTGTLSENIEIPNDLPAAYEAGSHNICALAGLNASLKWLAHSGRDLIAKQTMTAALALREGLTKTPGVILHAPSMSEPWCGILSFSVDGIRPQDVESVLGAQGFAVRAGLHCAPWAHRWLGTLEDGGTVRVSPSCLTDQETIEQFLNAVASITGA
jgi:selenocysteine lyase/cysteine desulfurase